MSNMIEGAVVYVSGPVTGRDYAEVCRNFADARDWLRAHGAAHVTIPTKLVDAGLGHEEAMRECVHELTKRTFDADEGALVRRPFYDLVVLLNGWRGSEGCGLEVSVAVECGVKIAELDFLRQRAFEASLDDEPRTCEGCVHSACGPSEPQAEYGLCRNEGAETAHEWRSPGDAACGDWEG